MSEILRIWLASLGLNLIQGILFWDYDEQTGDFRKCSDVSTCPVIYKYCFNTDVQVRASLCESIEKPVGKRWTIPVLVLSHILLYCGLYASLSHNVKW